MHTSPLYLPGTLSPVLSEVTAPENFSSVGSLGAGPVFGGFTYPGQCLALAEARAGALKFVTWPLTQVTGPPDANTAIESGLELPPVPGTAVPEHPLMVMVPLPTDPLIVVQAIFPFGPVLFADAGPLFNVTESTEIGTASTVTSMNAFRIFAPATSRIGRRI